jgi:hypothetical protein
MTKGQKVLVEGFDHEVVECRLYEVRGQTALVCNEQEWQDSQEQNREPDCLGWPLYSVREITS